MEGSKQTVKANPTPALDLADIWKDEETLREWLLDAALDPTSKLNPPLSRSNARKNTSHRNGWVFLSEPKSSYTESLPQHVEQHGQDSHI
jgi:hypothetical protein